MGSTPNFDTAGSGGYPSEADSSTDTGTSEVSRAAMDSSQTTMGSQSGTAQSGTTQTDDASFGHTSGQRGQSGSAHSARDTIKRGMSSAEDAVEQLQQKASEMTSRLINNIDVDDLTQKLEQQVRQYPARALLVAIGAGFLLGRAAKR